MITTDSYMELYGTLIGWYFYDQSWRLIVGSGLIFVLAIYWFYTNWRGPATSQEARAGFSTSVSRMEWDVYGGILIIFLFAWPVVPLTVNQLEFELQDGQRVNVNDNPSTFDGFFPDGEFTDIKVPLFWHGAMRITAGINTALIDAAPQALDFRKALTTLDYGFIKEPRLRHEVDRFYQECYRPALAKYQNWQNAIGVASIAPEDGREPFWPGSRTMRDLYAWPGCPVQQCGARLRAELPVRGFQPDPARDVEPEYQGNTQTPKSLLGRPYCTEWWEDSENGLRKRLLDVARAEDMEPGFLTTVFRNLTVAQEDDIAIRRLLENRPVLSTVNSQTAYANADRTFLGRVANRVTTLVGIELSTLFKSSGLYAWIRALPIMQGLLLMIFYTSAAFLMVLPGMRLQSLVALFVGFFTIKFLSVLWHYAYWIEQFFIGSIVDKDMLGVVVRGQTLDSQVLNYVLLFAYFLVPMAFVTLMGFVGYRAAAGINAVASAGGQEAARAGDTGTRAGLNAAKAVVLRSGPRKAK